MKINYRPEIDGLRALAIFSVIGYHANIKYIPGGFLGVDIFFVISGYLITSLIFQELKETGKFSFSNFYLRRFKRILPAMFFTIIITVLIGNFLLFKSDFLILLKSSLFAVLFSSNFYFTFLETNYWQNLTSTKPFLNLWSLSLEEQYYFIIPFSLLFLFKYFKNYILLFFIFIFVISILLSYNYNILSNPSSFFLIHTRIWEFVPGSLIAIYQNRFKLLTNKINDFYFVFIGIIMLGISLLLINKINLHIIFFNLFAVFGTSLLILYLNKNSIFYFLFSNKIVVFLGLISYSLYLFHYPLFTFYKMYFAKGSIFEELILIFAVFGLSIFSYFFVERKFRYGKTASIKIYILSIVTISIIILLLIFSKINHKQNEKIGNINLDNNFYSKEYNEGFIKPLNTHLPDKVNIVYIGDSQANNFYMSLALNYTQLHNLNLNFINLNSFECFYFVFFEIDQKCSDFRINLIEKKLIEKADAIHFIKRWNEIDIKYLKLFLEKKSNTQKILISNSNVPNKIINEKFTLLDNFLIKNQRLPNNKELISLEKNYFKYFSASISYRDNDKILKEISDIYNLHYIDRSKLQCNYENKRCLVLSKDNKKLIYDIDHYTIDGAKLFGQIAIDSKYLNIIKND